MAALRAVLGFVGRLLVALLVTVASLVLHLGTRSGKRAVRDVASAVLPAVVPGRLEVRELRVLTPSRVELVGVSWRDVADQPVVEDARIVVTPAWRIVTAALGRGAYPRIEARVRRVWARVPRLPPPDPRAAQPAGEARPLDIAFPKVELTADRVENALGGPPWTVRDLRGDVSVVFRRDQPDIHLRLLRAGIDLADLAPLRLDAAARVRGEREVSGALTLSGAPAGCALRAWSRAGDVFVESDGCAVSSRMLSTLASTTLPDVRIAQLRARRGADDAMRLDARVEVGGERFVLGAEARGDRFSASIASDRARLRWLPTQAPPLVIDGPIRATAERLQGGWGFTLDTTAVRAQVQGFDVPGLVASARLLGTRAEVTSLRVPSLGVTATASMDLGVGLPSAVAEVSATALPLARVAPPGTALSGEADLHATARGDGAAIRIALRGNVRGLRAPGGVRARAVGVEASGSVAEARNELHARVTVGGLIAAGSGPIDAVLNADGDPLSALRLRLRGEVALPAEVRRQLAGAGAPSRAAVEAEASVARDPRALRVRVSRLSVRAGDVAISARGGAEVETPAGGARLRRADLDLTVPGGGAAQLRMTGSVADLSLREISLRALAPIVPALAPIGGVVQGQAHVDLARPERSAGEIRVSELQAPYFGRMSPALFLRPARGGMNEVRLVWNVADAPPSDAFVLARFPRRFDDARGWIDGFQRGEVSLPRIDASVFQSNVGRGARVRGVVAAKVNLARSSRDELRVEATVEGSEVVLGFGLLGLRRDLVDPLRVRVAVCTEVDTRRGFNDPVRARAAVGVASENAAAPEFFGCDPATRPLPTPLADLAVAVDGPWLDAAGALGGATAETLRAPPAALLASLERVPLYATLNVGPIVRSRWPLRQIRVPGMPASMRQILAPPVEPDTRVGAEFRLEGTAASPRATLTVSASTSRVEQVGLESPVQLAAFTSVRSTGRSFADPIAVALDVRGAISPDASADDRGEINARASAQGRIGDALSGAEAFDLRELDVSTRNLRVERFGLLAARGARGAVDLRVRRTREPARPFDAVLTLRDLTAAPPGLERVARTIPPVGATLHAFVAQDGAAARLRACLVAALRESPAPCDPQSPTAPAETHQGAMRIDAELPFPQGVLGAPDTDNLAVSMRAEGFRLDALGALVPSTAVDNIGGVIQGEVVWSAERPLRPMGEISLRDGRATLASLGEPFSELDVALSVAGNNVRVHHVDGRLGSGRMHVEGTAALGEGDQIARVSLDARTDDLPAVANGYTWAWVTGSLHTDVTVRASGIDVGLDVHDARIRVQEEPARSLIALDADPSVFVLGRTRLAREEVADSTPIDLRFALETPIWLRRRDFAIAVLGQGSLHMDRAGNAVAATIEAARLPSWVSFYGKRFDLERAVVTLDGGLVVNPTLDLRARHETGAEGALVLTLQGRLYEPEITLVAEQHPELSMAEALQLLITGRTDASPTTGQSDLAEQAGNLARSLVTGLTLGFVTSTLQSQVSWLPTLIVEPGTTDPGRYGAGFNLGPRFYLQATYGTVSSAVGLGAGAAGGGGEEFRALLEYAINSALNASVTAGYPMTGPTSGNVSVGTDVYWSP